jgi:hypothetical protein
MTSFRAVLVGPNTRGDPPTGMSPGGNRRWVESDDAPDPQVRNPSGADEVVEAGAMDAEPLRDLTRVPQRLDGVRIGMAHEKAPQCSGSAALHRVAYSPTRPLWSLGAVPRPVGSVACA